MRLVPSNGPLGIIADIHDREDFVEEATAYFDHHDVQHVLVLGDVTTGETLRLFEDFSVHLVLGNGDFSNHKSLIAAVQDIGGFCYGESGVIEFQTRTDITTILFRHGMNPAGVDTGPARGVSYALAATEYDYVFHGHYHYVEHTHAGSGEVFNPGARGVALYDAEADSIEFQEFEDFEAP